MANNPYVNKVEYGGQTLMDISDTSAVASDVEEGKEFYTASGAKAVGTATHSVSYAAIGSVLMHAGETAPSGYLVCDGTTYNIADYEELAAFFETNYGANNYWGGDGESTFAVPDWQGEFFRAAGTQSRENQGSGAAVGVHQDGTRALFPIMRQNDGFLIINYNKTGSESYQGVIASDFHVTNRTSISAFKPNNINPLSDNVTVYDAVRPTNTSLLVCIKAKMIDNMSAILAAVTNELSSKFDPVGKVIYYAGETAPTNYLACDGAVYNIEDYPALAQFMADNYSANNYWGGDGTTTFAVPNWQGEFFRAAGTQSRADQGSGATTGGAGSSGVGVHQDATNLPRMAVTGTTLYVHRNNTYSYEPIITKVDSNITAADKYVTINGASVTDEASSTYAFTSRPTNTSLLVCIKAT